MECHYKFEKMLLQYTRTLFDKNDIFGGTEKSSEGFDQLQMSCSCGNGIACAKFEKLITQVSSICQNAFTMLWLSLAHALWTANICQVSQTP